MSRASFALLACLAVLLRFAHVATGDACAWCRPVDGVVAQTPTPAQVDACCQAHPQDGADDACSGVRPDAPAPCTRICCSTSSMAALVRARWAPDDPPSVAVALPVHPRLLPDPPRLPAASDPRLVWDAGPPRSGWTVAGRTVVLRI